jgi:catechol 2,3-dioxygenase-like lactoylglutathione lyase family enzyme
LVSWYVRNLGFELLGPVRHLNKEDHPEAFTTIFVSYPEEMRELKFAILTSGNGVGLELFQFIDPAPVLRNEAFEFTRVGFFHICVTDPNPESLVEKVGRDGGKQLGGWMDYSRYGLAGHKGVYMQDPWGNVVEVMSISIERVCSAGGALAWMLEQQSQEDEPKISSS